MTLYPNEDSDRNAINCFYQNSKLKKNIILSIIGQIIPLIMSLLSIPFIITYAGNSRFGALSLIWIFIGYSNLFDLGISRALAKLTAERLTNANIKMNQTLVWTALCFILIVSLFLTIFCILITPYFVRKLLSIPNSLELEMIRSFYILSLAIPIMLLFAALNGILEAYQKFDRIVSIQIPLGIIHYLCPLCAFYFNQQLDVVVVVLVICRLVSTCVLFLYLKRDQPQLLQVHSFSINDLQSLISFGGWVTVSNIVSQIMIFSDRFFIGLLITMEAVAYFSLPYDLITKLLIIPHAICIVLFPAFSTSYSYEIKDSERLFKSNFILLLLIFFPVIALIITFSQEGLAFWVGNVLSMKSKFVLQCLAFGIFFNALAFIPYTFLQGVGRPDLTAKFHIIEICFYLPLLWMSIMHYGINGAAVIWVARIVLDVILLYNASFTIIKQVDVIIIPFVICSCLLFVLIVLSNLSGYYSNVFYKSFYLFAMLLIYGFIAKKVLYINK